MRSLKPRDLQDVNLLDLVPVRVAEWEETDDGRVVILRPLPTSGFPRRLLDRLLYEMSTKRIRLDAVGSSAWRAVDGMRTVGEVAATLRDAFRDMEHVEERLGALVSAFRREEFVAFRGIDPEAGAG